MENNSFTYNKKKIVDEFASLTDFEYSLLPIDVQMAYVAGLYELSIRRTKMNKLNGYEKYTVRRHIQEKYRPYFDAMGCRFKNVDFAGGGADITCFDTNRYYEVAEENKEKLAYYFTVVAQARTDVFESYCKRFYQSKIDAIETGNDLPFSSINEFSILNSLLYKEVSKLDLDITEEEKKHIMEAELIFFIRDLEQGNKTVDIENLPEEYKNLLDEIKESLEVTEERAQVTPELKLN